MLLGSLAAILSSLGEIATLKGDRADVSEVFGPGRFTSQASHFDLCPGTAMDIRTGYDFSIGVDRDRAREQRRSEKPKLLIGSPPCAAFSVLQNLAADTPAWRAKLRQGLSHLEFVCELYKEQIADGNFFLHEHPGRAASWALWRPCRECRSLTVTNAHLGCGPQTVTDRRSFSNRRNG